MNTDTINFDIHCSWNWATKSLPCQADTVNCESNCLKLYRYQTASDNCPADCTQMLVLGSAVYFPFVRTINTYVAEDAKLEIKDTCSFYSYCILKLQKCCYCSSRYQYVNLTYPLTADAHNVRKMDFETIAVTAALLVFRDNTCSSYNRFLILKEGD